MRGVISGVLLVSVVSVSLWATGSQGLRMPTAPNAPRAPTVVTNQAPVRVASATNAAQSNVRDGITRQFTDWKVRIFFVDGRMLEGTVSLEVSEYIVDFTINGIRFHRNLSFSETASIRVNRWVPMPSTAERVEGQSGTLYYFMPELYRIIARDGEVYRLDKRMKIFDTFVLHTPRGNTRVYSYFADYWIGTEGDGQWQNSGSKDFNHNNTRPHSGAVYRIDFLP